MQFVDKSFCSQAHTVLKKVLITHISPLYWAMDKFKLLGVNETFQVELIKHKTYDLLPIQKVYRNFLFLQIILKNNV